MKIKKLFLINAVILSLILSVFCTSVTTASPYQVDNGSFDFEDNVVVVYVLDNEENAARNFTTEDFPEVTLAGVEKRRGVTFNPYFPVVLTLENNGKENVLAAITALENNPLVSSATPQYKSLSREEYFYGTPKEITYSPFCIIVTVVNNETTSSRKYLIEDFPEIDITFINYWYHENTDIIHLTLQLKNPGWQNVFDAVEAVKSNPLVESAYECSVGWITDPLVSYASEEESSVTSDVVTSVTSPAEKLTCDINEDGNITTADALLTLQYSVKKCNLTIQQKTNADKDGDGDVTAYDALIILQFSVKTI